MTKSMKEQEHNLHLEDIVERLSDDFVDWKAIKQNEEYRFGELDVMAVACRPFDGNRMVIFEYKCTDLSQRRHKAMRQLERARDFYSRRGYRVSTFYCHGDPIRYELIV